MKKSNYFVSTLNGMAYGFFCSLIIGNIMKQFGTIFHMQDLIIWGNTASYLMGPAIGVGIAYVINAKGLNLIAAAIAGAIGAGTFSGNQASIGNPVTAYLATIASVEITKIIQGKTPLDILLVPFVSITVAGLLTLFITPYAKAFMDGVAQVINSSMQMQPFLMSILVATVMGLAMTGPISSAALAVMLNLSGLAAGAALAGCCAQMMGFAVMSIEDNNIGNILAVGLGTSKLQFKNVVRNPLILIPPLIVGMIISVISTLVFHIQCNAIGAGMGTSGLVGILSALDVMGSQYALVIVILDIIVPACLTYILYSTFKKARWIKKGDLSLQQL